LFEEWVGTHADCVFGGAAFFVSKTPFYLELCWKKYGNVLYIR